METITCHNNQSALASAIENTVFVEANAMSFSFIALIASEKLIFLNIFRKFSLSVAMTTDETVGFGQKIYVW